MTFLENRACWPDWALFPDNSELRKGVRRGRQCGAGPGAVVIHLPDQRFDALELQFVPQEGDKGDVQPGAVEVALEIEQKHLEQGGAVVEGGAAAEACHAVEALSAASDPDRIDAVSQPAGRIEPDIRGRVAEIAPTLVAMGDLAADEPGPAEQRLCMPDIACFESGAHQRRGYRLALEGKGRHHGDGDAGMASAGLQHLRRAGAALAEMEIEADRDAGDAEPPDQIVVNEIHGRGAGAGRIERHHHSPRKAGCGQQPQLVGQLGELELRRVGTEKTARMRLEGYRQRRPAMGASHVERG